MIGTVLQGKYRIERKIGAGGFATVYCGTHEQLKRPVAIKVLNDAGGDQSFQERFVREAEAMARLNHPNIVTVYDCSLHEGRPYIVMEYVNGPTLYNLIQKTALTLPQVCAIGQQICQAMSCAHKAGIIHRDLTLRNIMITDAGQDKHEVKVLDFGLAKLIHEEVETTGRGMVGTPYYMAPEMIRNEAIDGRVDIFSFGVCLYRMVNGRFPFEAEHNAALMYMIVNELDVAFAEGVDDGMKDLILSCLEKDPRSRVADFDTLSAALERLKQHCETVAGETSSTLPGLDALAKRSSKRNPYLNRVMIKHPGDFYGREREVRKIYSRLDAPHPQSISVVGERRIGKSSLLNYIYHPRNRRRHMQNDTNAIFVYLDFQQKVAYDVPRFIDFLFSMFSYESRSQDYTKRERTLDQLREVVQDLHERGKRIIILMDEFDAITRNERFQESFFSFLRSLANSYRVAYVTSSYRDLQTMCHNKDISESPFFNIFSNMPLRPFSRGEAVALIQQPSEREGVPLAEYVEPILELAGYFPFFIQVACSIVFESLVDNPGETPDWEQIRRSFMDEANQHYQYIWERFDAGSRDNLARIAGGKAINKKYSYINEELERRGYLLRRGDELNICSSSFTAFVGRQVGKDTGKRGLLGGLLGRKG